MINGLPKGYRHAMLVNVNIAFDGKKIAAFCMILFGRPKVKESERKAQIEIG